MTSCCGPAEYDGKGTNIPPGCNFANAVIRGCLSWKPLFRYVWSFTPRLGSVSRTVILVWGLVQTLSNVAEVLSDCLIGCGPHFWVKFYFLHTGLSQEELPFTACHPAASTTSVRWNCSKCRREGKSWVPALSEFIVNVTSTLRTTFTSLTVL